MYSCGFLWSEVWKCYISLMYIVNVACTFYLMQRWAHCYRDSSYHAAVETNNGIEAQNKALKYKFLSRKSVSLSCIATIILERFLLEQHRNYLFLNFQMDPSYRAYNTHIPPYLRGWPRNIILHCLGCEEKARKVLSSKNILKSDKEKGIFLVCGESGCTYTIDFGKESGKPSCTCQDWMTNNIPCKHFF